MSRKDDSKAKDAIVTVNIDDFTRTRDSVSSFSLSPFPLRPPNRSATLLFFRERDLPPSRALC